MLRAGYFRFWNEAGWRFASGTIIGERLDVNGCCYTIECNGSVAIEVADPFQFLVDPPFVFRIASSCT